MNLLQRAGKNIFWLFTSEVCMRGVMFVATLYLARTLGTSGFGLYSLGVTTGIVLWGIADVGVTGYGLREVAKNRGKAQELLSSLNSMRIFIAISIFMLFIILLFLLNISSEKGILLAGSIYILTYSISPEWVFQGLEEMRYLVIGKLAISLLFLALILITVKDQTGTFTATLFYSLSYLVGGLIFLLVLSVKFKINFTFNFKINEWWNHFKESFFFFLGGNLLNIGTYIPIFFISIFSTNEQLGIFSVSYRLIGIIFAVGNIVTNGIYPMLSNLFLEDIKSFRNLQDAYQNLVIFIGFPMAIGGMFLSTDIVLLLFGQNYESSGNIMKILIWLVPLSLLRLNYGRTLLSANFHRFNSIALGSGMVITIISGILFIPRHGGQGAAWALLMGEMTTLLMMKWVSSIKLNTARLLTKNSLKIFIASALVGVILLILPFHVLINIMLGIVFYGVLAFVFGIISREKIIKGLRGSIDF